MLSAAVLHADTLLPDDLVSSGIIDEACRDEMDESEFESFDRLFSQLPAMKGEYIDMTCTLYMCASTVLYCTNFMEINEFSVLTIS